MTGNEADRIIGAYMENDEGIDYHLSLDALVPVWEKLDFRHHDFNLNQDNKFFWEFNVGTDSEGNSWYGEAPTIQIAAAIATAAAIQEMKK